jgi:hypothetical protein
MSVIIIKEIFKLIIKWMTNINRVNKMEHWQIQKLIKILITQLIIA